MATVVGTIKSVSGFEQPAGPTPKLTIATQEQRMESCLVGVIWPAGTYASNDDANFNPQSAIQTTRRDGKTVTVLQACMVAPGNENGAEIGGGPCAVAANVVTVELKQEDMSTERADGAMSATWNRPVMFRVTYVAPIN